MHCPCAPTFSRPSSVYSVAHISLRSVSIAKALRGTATVAQKEGSIHYDENNSGGAARGVCRKWWGGDEVRGVEEGEI